MKKNVRLYLVDDKRAFVIAKKFGESFPEIYMQHIDLGIALDPKIWNLDAVRLNLNKKFNLVLETLEIREV